LHKASGALITKVSLPAVAARVQRRFLGVESKLLSPNPTLRAKTLHEKAPLFA